MPCGTKNVLLNARYRLGRRSGEKVHTNLEDEDMAAFDTTRTTYGSTGLIGRIGSLFVSAFAAAVAWNDARVTKNSLESLSDRELADIGLCRGDIDSVAEGRQVF